MTWEEDLNRELQVVQGLLIESEEQGAKRERKHIIRMLEGLREQYNLESINLNEIRVAKYEALSSAVDLIKGGNK